MNSDLISCIIPVYNGEPYLRETLQSVLAQTYRPIEILVIDDGSTDGTAATATGYGELVKYLWQRNAGPVIARNCGIAEARGEFIAFLDADDLWHAEKLERQRRFLNERQDLGYCVTCCQNFWVPELTTEAERFRNHRISKPMAGYVTGTLLARRAVFDAVGAFNTGLAHGDATDWYCRAAERGVAGELLPDVLMYRRLHPGNRSRVLAANSRMEFIGIVKARLDRRRGASRTGE